MKLKNILCAAFLSVAVAIVFCGCGNETEKSQETGIEIKKISEEEVYELYAQVKQKREKIEEARLSMDQGFQEKWDLLKRKMDSADLALGKNNFDTASKFLQEAESAADWIMNRGPLRAEADEKMKAATDAKIAASAFFAQASRYYLEATSYERQGNTAYEKGNFEDAARLFSSAVTSFRQALGDFVPYYFVKVEPGTFKRKDFKRKEQQVTLTKPFYIGKYEVTQAQWNVVMGNNPSRFKGDNRPVESVSWHDAMAFCEKLNDYGYAPRGYKFTLPTEAQWEFAARGGNLSKGYDCSGSNDINEVAWCYDNSYSEKHHDVGRKKANELGLYDMSGNVWEWCLDWYDAYGGYGDAKEVTDPTGPQDGSSRVLRGGSWLYSAYYCHVAYRNGSYPGNRNYNDCGFRLALVPVQ